MHELAIAQTIMEHVLRQIEEHAYGQVQTVVLRIGELTDVVPEALQFGFEVSARETPLEETTLRIESIPIKCRCDSCAIEFIVSERFLFQCPECNCYSVTLLAGNELEIAYLEIDDDPTRTTTCNPPEQKARAK